MFDRRKGFRPQKKKKTVQPNSVEKEPLGWDILRLNHDGRGVAIRKSGKTVFVSNALPGEQVRLRVDKQHKRFDEATAVEILQASPQRIPPACRYADRCGGCQLQHMPYEAQLNYKEELLTDHLKHLAGLQAVKLEPSVAAPDNAFHYRRRARLSIPPPGEAVRLGFRARGSDDVIAVEDCKTLHPTLNALLPALQETLKAMHGNRSLGHVELLLNEQQDNAHASVIVRMLESFNEDESALWQAFARTHSCDVVAQYNHGFEVVAATCETPLELGYRVDNERLHYGPGEFIQVNAHVNEQMVAQALAWLELKGTETVLELFAGFGNFSVPLAKRSAKVVAVEVAEQQVTRGSINAELAKCHNLKFIRADLSKPFTEYAFGKQPVDVMLLDPPRAGAADVVADLSYVQPERILYISCNAATFARDAAVIMEQGYQLVKVSMLDMFPQTAHAESMALFIKQADTL
ncbi:23S rRNA (uracil(1939)-C(5))-methyltransferase RlmD [Aliidiomarina taiwanensis]|uniref:23S rRNA (uracil(1939)-C(5))-methyltransferase RlmD n=1 Tax=Aliidiomarina taiwanensis TaxID=946228 RepID=UPI00130065F5|nr:23S rRNA (uracil(1939)-C(5))-methyltransferase RlmD [Aliidiomarina taiwanensis]